MHRLARGSAAGKRIGADPLHAVVTGAAGIHAVLPRRQFCFLAGRVEGAPVADLPGQGGVLPDHVVTRFTWDPAV